MVMRKVIKLFNCRRGVVVEGYVVFIGSREVFESMNCGLIVLCVGKFLYEAINFRIDAISGQVQVASQLMQPTMLC